MTLEHSRCRICLDRSPSNDLCLLPCSCRKGPIGYVHRACLSKWRSYQQKQNPGIVGQICDVCKEKWMPRAHAALFEFIFVRRKHEAVDAAQSLLCLCVSWLAGVVINHVFRSSYRLDWYKPAWINQVCLVWWGYVAMSGASFCLQRFKIGDQVNKWMHTQWDCLAEHLCFRV